MKPKRSLRSSQDVYHRLKWSGEYPLDRLTIGYEDRHSGMEEIVFGEFYPEGRIPWSRVWYFALDGERIWDREKRQDRVFGSGDSTEGDILRKEEWEAQGATHGEKDTIENYRREALRIEMVQKNDWAEADWAGFWEKCPDQVDMVVVEAGKGPASLPVGWQATASGEWLCLHCMAGILRHEASGGLHLEFRINGKPLHLLVGAPASAPQTSILIQGPGPLPAGHTDLAERLAFRKNRGEPPRISFKSPDVTLVPWKLTARGEHHFSAHFLLQPSYRLLATAATTHQSALAYVPPPSTWGAIQSLRRDLDPQFQRWMPHINLLYGFLPDPLFPAAAALLAPSLSELTPFSISLREWGHFDHHRQTTLWLRPDPEATERLQELQALLLEIFPQCTEQNQHGTFQPHLSVAKVAGHWNAMELKGDLQKSWPGWDASVGAICLLSRRGDGPMEVRQVIPWTEPAPRRQDFNIGGQDLETALGAWGLNSSPLEALQRDAAIQMIQGWCRGWESRVQVMTIGATGLEATGPGQEISLLAIGRMSRENFQAQMVTQGGVEIPSGCRLELGGVRAQVSYISFPADVPLNRPHHLPTEVFRQFSEFDQEILAKSLEIAALRRHLDAGLPVYRVALRALRLWTQAQGIDSAEYGFPGGLAWNLMLAGTPWEETPEHWLENMFQRLVRHRWYQPLTVREGYFVPHSDDPLQIYTLALPQRNTARHVPASYEPLLHRKFTEALETIQHIQAGKAEWQDFLRPASPPTGPAFMISLSGENDAIAAAQEHWKQEFLTVFPELEALADSECYPGPAWEMTARGAQFSVFGKLGREQHGAAQVFWDGLRQQYQRKFPGLDFRMKWREDGN